MTDGTVLSAAVGTGDTVMDFADGAFKWASAVACYVTAGSANAWTLTPVKLTTGLPVQPQTGSTWAVSVASLPLPAGAATAANQATANTSLASIDGKITACNTSAVTISAALPGGTNKIGGVTIADGDAATIGATTDAAATTDTGTFSVVALVKRLLSRLTTFMGQLPAALTGGGNLKVSLQESTASQAVTGTFWQTTQPVSGTVTANAGTGTFTISGAVTQSGTWNIGTVTTVTTCSTVTSLSQWAGNAIDTNSGNKSAGTLRVVIATDQPALTNKLLVTADPITFASAQAVTQSGTWNVTVNTALPGGTNNIGQVSLAPQTSGGLSTYPVISSGAANQDSAAVKGSAGQLYGYALFNTTSSARFVKLYNKASGATSADTPMRRIYLPPTGGVDRSEPNGIAFGTGLCIRITTGSADNDTGACSTGDVLANVDYK